MGSKTDTYSDTILGLLEDGDRTGPTNLWVSLTKTSGGAGTPTDSSSGYDLTTNQGRQQITAATGWDGPQAPSSGSGRALVNSNAISWTSWDSGDNGAVVTGFNIWDSSNGTTESNRLYWGTVTTPRTMATGETATFAAQALEIIED